MHQRSNALLYDEREGGELRGFDLATAPAASRPSITLGRVRKLRTECSKTSEYSVFDVRGVFDSGPGVLTDPFDRSCNRWRLAHRDGVVEVVVGACRDDVLGKEHRIGAQREASARPGAARPSHQLAHKPLGAALGVVRIFAKVKVHHHTDIGASRQQRVIVQGLGVAVTRALLVLSVDLTDREIEFDGLSMVTGASLGPRPRAQARVSNDSDTASSWRT